MLHLPASLPPIHSLSSGYRLGSNSAIAKQLRNPLRMVDVDAEANSTPAFSVTPVHIGNQFVPARNTDCLFKVPQAVVDAVEADMLQIDVLLDAETTNRTGRQTIELNAATV